MSEGDELPVAASAVRQGLHRNGADLGADIRARDSGGAARGHGLLLPRDSNTAAEGGAAASAQRRRAQAQEELSRYAILTRFSSITISTNCKSYYGCIFV